MKYSKSKEVNEIVEKVLDQGWTIETGAKHYVLVPVDRTKRKIAVPGTPGDHRSVLNFRAEVRRAGGIV